MTDSSASAEPIKVDPETDKSVQINTEENIKLIESENLANQENKETVSISEPEKILTEEMPKIEETEKLELVPEKTSEEVEAINEPVQDENNTLPVDKPVQQDTLVEQPTPASESGPDHLMSGSLIESATPAEESLLEHTQDQIVPVQESMMDDNPQQAIPVNESVSNNNDGVKLDDSGVDLDQQSVLTMKDSELKDLVMRELSEFLTEDQSQNVQSLPDIKTVDIKVEQEQKIENVENILSGETSKITLKEEKKSENDIADALSTLATAALNQGPPTNGTMDNVISKPTQPIVQVRQEGPAWCDVGVIKGSTCLVKQFYSTSTTDEHENTSLDHLPDYSNKLKIDIQPGTAYKLRIAAINTCGRGEWSEISAFKTCLPGYPGAPSAIKITKAPDGASLTWEAPPSSSGKILEYSVCLAIKNRDGTPQSPKPTTTSLNFVRVYCGPHNAAVVSHESLGAALIDRTNKPAIIFRIAARNEKGYGPATQVRWLQDSSVPGSTKNPSLKREKSVNLLTGVPKRPKI